MRAPLGAAVVPEVSPRERALRELDAIRSERLFDRPSPAPFYERVSVVLRTYLADVDPRWGRDLTTTELSAAMLPAATPEMAARLRALLREADAVKFANARPDATTGRKRQRTDLIGSTSNAAASAKITAAQKMTA